MTLTIDISPKDEAWLLIRAQNLGVAPTDLAQRLFREKIATEAQQPPNPVTEDDPLIRRLDALIAAAPRDPQAIREAEDDLNELMRNMNANRAATGERLPFPDAE